MQTLLGLRDLGNSVLVVEHDEETIRSADWVIDFGPGAGEHGGHVIAEGPVERIERTDQSLTGAYLAGRESIPIPRARRSGNGSTIIVEGASANNLKDLTVGIPLGAFVCVTGVSARARAR